MELIDKIEIQGTTFYPLNFEFMNKEQFLHLYTNKVRFDLDNAWALISNAVAHNKKVQANVGQISEIEEVIEVVEYKETDKTEANVRSVKKSIGKSKKAKS